MSRDGLLACGLTEAVVRWPEHRLVVEADSMQCTTPPQARTDDAERQALLEATATASSASPGTR